MIKRGPKRHNPHIRKLQKQAKSSHPTTRVQNQIKSSHNKGTKPNKDRSDALLGDPIVNAKKAKATG